MRINNESALTNVFKAAVNGDDQPVLVRQYIQGYERRLMQSATAWMYCAGAIQHIERPGYTQGFYQRISPLDLRQGRGRILEYTKKLGAGLGITNLFNVQFVVSLKVKSAL